jgi:hypothetical protein
LVWKQQMDFTNHRTQSAHTDQQGLVEHRRRGAEPCLCLSLGPGPALELSFTYHITMQKNLERRAYHAVSKYACLSRDWVASGGPIAAEPQTVDDMGRPPLVSRPQGCDLVTPFLSTRNATRRAVFFRMAMPQMASHSCSAPQSAQEELVRHPDAGSP